MQRLSTLDPSDVTAAIALALIVVGFAAGVTAATDIPDEQRRGFEAIDAEMESVITEGEIGFNDTHKTVQSGETFWVAVTYRLAGAAQTGGVFGVQFTLEYDPSILEALAIRKGPYLGSDTLRVAQTVNNSAGTVEYGEVRTATTGITGNGAVAFIKFKARETCDAPLGATVPLEFATVKISTPQSEPIPTDVTNGTVDTVDPCPPEAAFSVNRSSANVSEPIRFNATSSSDNYHVSTFQWDFDSDGRVDETRQDPVTSHRFHSPGTTTISLTVTDADGGTDTTSRRVTVYEKTDETPPAARVRIDNQEYPNSTDVITVTSAVYETSDFAVAIHNASASPPLPIIGWSSNLDAGTNRNITVNLSQTLERNVTVVAMLHEHVGGPIIRRDGTPVTATADVKITTEPKGIISEYDDDADGVIQTPELLVAIQDWSEGSLATETVVDLIMVWARSG